MNTQLWDRTRWDRLQVSVIIGAIALVSSVPTWAIVALTRMTVQVQP